MKVNGGLHRLRLIAIGASLVMTAMYLFQQSPEPLILGLLLTYNLTVLGLSTRWLRAE